MNKTQLMKWNELPPRTPVRAKVEEVDLLVVRYGEEQVSVLYGRCPHRGVLLANGTLVGSKIICSWHGWEFRYDSGAAGQRCPDLEKFNAWVEDDYLCVDADQIRQWREQNLPCDVASEQSG